MSRREAIVSVRKFFKIAIQSTTQPHQTLRAGVERQILFKSRGEDRNMSNQMECSSSCERNQKLALQNVSLRQSIKWEKEHIRNRKAY